MFKVVYKYSACIKIITDDVTILCDPWFNEAYYGTWIHQNTIDNIEEFIGDFDIVYISHIHPDHYDPHTLDLLFKRYGEKKIIIADWGDNLNYLEKKIKSDGFYKQLKVSNKFEYGNTNINIVPNNSGSISDIDSAILVSSKTTNKGVLNINDCIYNENHFKKIKNIQEKLKINICLFCLGYTGAGPYPQTYFSPFLQKKLLEKKAQEKKNEFFGRYMKAIKLINSEKRLPFAGKYLLQGYLSILNNYRGVADALDIKDLDQDAIVLDDNGDSFFDIENMICSKERQYRYNIPEVINNNKNYYWQEIISFYPQKSLLKRLLIKSIKNAHPKSECLENCWYSFYVFDKPDELFSILEKIKPEQHYKSIITFNCNKYGDPFDLEEKNLVHSHIFIDSKALFAVLTGITHWNNYEIGSVFQVRRYPDIFIREMSSYLNFLSVV